jgi:hypothetical protein
MNDEKTLIINMVSSGTIAPSEGIALFKSLCDLEDITPYESDVEVDDPRYLPPWESEGDELHELLNQNKCARAIASANQQIISALEESRLDDIPSRLSAFDVIQLSRCNPATKEGGNGGFVIGSFRLRYIEDGLQSQGWGFWLSSSMHTDTDLKLPPTWGEPMMMQILMLHRILGSIRLKGQTGEEYSEEIEQVKVTSRIESIDDSVIAKAGQFDNCLKLCIDARPIKDIKFEEGLKHDINDKIRRIGTQSIWFAPNVGIVKFLYEHPNNTQTDVELVDYDVQSGESIYFPLSLGNRWQYQWQDPLTIHRELIRVILDKGEGSYVLSCSNHIESI